MIYLLFQLLDALTIIFLAAAQFDILPGSFLFYHATYLIIKGGWYWMDPFSWIDIMAGIYLLIIILSGPSWLFSAMFGAYFLYKAIFFFVLS